jgi:hypothetical protein
MCREIVGKPAAAQTAFLSVLQKPVIPLTIGEYLSLEANSCNIGVNSLLFRLFQLQTQGI